MLQQTAPIFGPAAVAVNGGSKRPDFCYNKQTEFWSHGDSLRFLRRARMRYDGPVFLVPRRLVLWHPHSLPVPSSHHNTSPCFVRSSFDFIFIFFEILRIIFNFYSDVMSVCARPEGCAGLFVSWLQSSTACALWVSAQAGCVFRARLLCFLGTASFAWKLSFWCPLKGTGSDHFAHVHLAQQQCAAVVGDGV